MAVQSSWKISFDLWLESSPPASVDSLGLLPDASADDPSAFEDHRYWDMKRWRLADKVWNGNNNDPQARHRRLWPYRVVAPGDPNDGKWVFVEDFLFMSPNARYFRMQNYYNFLDLGWVNNNPKLVKNPYQ